MKNERMWMIVGKYGLYVGSALTRREAVDGFVRDIYGDPDSYRGAWKKCRARGDRVVRVTITWDEKKGKKP